MSWPKPLLCLAGSPSMNGLSPQTRIKTPEETSEQSQTVDQVVQSTNEIPIEAKSATVVVPFRQWVIAKEYFSALVKSIKPGGLTFSVCQADPPSSSLQAELGLFDLQCRNVAQQLEALLEALKQSWIKAYLLEVEELTQIQANIQIGIQQIVEVAGIARAVQLAPSKAHFEKLEHALNRLEETRTSNQDRLPKQQQVGRLVVLINLVSPAIGGTWWLLAQAGILAASSPWVIGISFAAWMIVLILNNLTYIQNQILEIKEEDRQTLVTQCHALITTFDNLRGKRAMEHLFTLTENTATAAQAAANAAQEANEATNEAKHAVDNQSQQIAELKQENAQLKEIIVKQNEKIEEQSKKLEILTEGQQQTNHLLAELLKQKNEVVEKKV